MSNLEENNFEIIKKIERSQDDEMFENLRMQTEKMFLEDEADRNEVSSLFFTTLERPPGLSLTPPADLSPLGGFSLLFILYCQQIRF